MRQLQNVSRLRVSSRKKIQAVRCLKIFNIVLMLTICAYHTGSFLGEYLQFPTMQSVHIDKSGKLEFPAVTICNNNKINFMTICFNAQEEEREGIDSLWNNLKALSTERCSISKTISLDLDIPYSSVNVFACDAKRVSKLTEEENEIAVYYDNILKLNKTERENVGHNLKELVKKCAYYFQPCDFSKFTNMSSVDTGNCYKFKPDKTIKPSSGLNSGLTIVFSLQRRDYFLTRYIVNAYGIRVSLGPSHDELDIEKETSFFLTDNIYSIIAIKQLTVKRLKAPYAENCRDYFGSTRTNCTNSCVQRFSTRLCSCYNPLIGEYPGYPACDFSNLTQICCLKKAESELVKNAERCSCPSPCLETKYEASISYNEMPKWFLEEGEGKFKIYFSNLDQVVYSTHGKYTMQDVLGGIGGHLGLWLGLSLLSSLESFQIMLLRYFSGKPESKSGKSVRIKSVK